jgi:PAS domain S-box-containing protein
MAGGWLGWLGWMRGRRAAPDSLRVLEAHRLALEAAGLATWTYDPRTDALTWDDHCKAFFDLPPETEVTAELFLSRVHPDDVAHLQAARRAALDPDGRGEYADEYRVINPSDGGVRWLASYGRVFFDPATRAATRFSGVAFDVTARKRAEGEREQLVAQLAAERARVTALLENLPIAVGFHDVTGRFILSNPALQQLVPSAALPARDPSGVSEWRGFSPDGQALDASEMPAARALRGETVAGLEFLHRRHDSGAERWWRIGAVPMRDADHAITGALAFLVDIDREKQAEAALRKLNEELEQRVARAVTERLKAEASLHQSQKIEAIGMLTGGVAHDFNNLLTAILGNLELVEMRLTDDRLRRPIEAAIRSADRGARLIEQLLAFSRKQHLAPKPVDLNAAVSGMSEMLRRTLGGTVDVKTELAPDAWPALIDPTQLELAILNLAINARDAMPLGGSLVIGTRNVAAGESARPADLAAGDYTTVAVSDSGEGMTEEVLARAFEPFFTTKEVGKGSGLGLSQVYGLVKQSGGGVALTSERGHGTTVTLFLPRAPGAEAAASETVAAAMRRGRGRVLVVDDQDDVREVAVGYLEMLGYDTAEAASGRAALALLDDGLAVDLALVDYAMPGMTGLELMRALEIARPGLPVLIATGYADFAPDDARLGGLGLLKKPFRLQALGSALDEAFRRAAERAPNVLPLRTRRP